MQHKFLKFQTKKYAVPFTGRRFRGLNRGSAIAYKSEGDPDPDPEKEAFLNKVKETVVSECQAKGFKNADEIKAIIVQALEGLDMENMKKFKFAEIQQSVTNLAATVEKIQNNSKLTGGSASEKLNHLKLMLQDKKVLGKIERAFNDKEFRVRLDVTQAAAVMTTGNGIADGDIPEDILNSFSVDNFVKKRRPAEYIYDVVSRRTVAKITEYKTWLEEGDEQGNFAIVAEGGLKPLVSTSLVRNTSKYRKVAGKKVYTEEFVKFRQEAYNIIEDLLNDKLLRDYANILQTDLLAWAAGYVGTTLDGAFDNPTDYHAIGAVAAQIESLNFTPDLLILNPQDKWRIGLSQGTDGHFFINIPIINPGGQVQMLGFRVLTTTKMTAGTFMLGESGLYKIEDEPITVRLGYGINVTKDGEGKVTEVESDVDHNRFRIIVETFFHDYVASNHTGSFVKADFDDVKEALTSPT